jgi:hypothetical protein
VLGASEVVHYVTIIGVAQFYQTVQAAIPSIQQPTADHPGDVAGRRLGRTPVPRHGPA